MEQGSVRKEGLDGPGLMPYNIARIMAIYFINTVTLKNETNKVIRRVAASREPVIVTQHGHPAVAIIPLNETDLVIRGEKAFIRAVEQGLRDIKAGRTTSLKAFVRHRGR